MAKKKFIDLSIHTTNMRDKMRAICVVCDMIVSKKAHFATKFKGKNYYFCCNDCKSAFEKNPYKYVLG